MKTAAFLLLALCASIRADIRLTWPPVIEAGVAGYRVHWGPVDMAFPESNILDVGNQTTAAIPSDKLTSGTHFFRLTLYSTSGISSAFSPPLEAVITTTHEAILQESTDLQSWTTIATLSPPLVAGTEFRFVVIVPGQESDPFFISTKNLLTLPPVAHILFQGRYLSDWTTITTHPTTEPSGFYRVRIQPIQSP